MKQNKVQLRLLILAGLALLWMSGVFGRLAYLQLVRHSDYMARAMRQQRRTLEITPKRGVIYDRNMHPLAMSVPVQSGFTVYVPVMLSGTMVPLELIIAVAVVLPNPSKTCAPTSATGPAISGGAVMTPVAV